MAAPATQQPAQNGDSAEQQATGAGGSLVEISLTLDEARVLRAVAQRGMLATGAEGMPNGQPKQATTAIGKLAAVLEEAETVALVRAELERAGFETRLLSDAQVSSLGRRMAEIPRRAAR